MKIILSPFTLVISLILLPLSFWVGVNWREYNLHPLLVMLSIFIICGTVLSIPANLLSFDKEEYIRAGINVYNLAKYLGELAYDKCFYLLF